MKKPNKLNGIKNPIQNCDESRREFMTLMSTLSSAVLLERLLPNKISFAQDGSAKGKFLLYLHLGSWDGLASGLISPTSTSGFPVGSFVRGMPTGSVNPLITRISQSGNLFFHHYARPLSKLTEHMLMSVITPRSLAHPEARLFQGSGSKQFGPSGQATWANGIAEIMKSQNFGSGLVIDSNFVSQVTNLTPNVNRLSARSLAEFRLLFRDHPGIPVLADGKDPYLNAMRGQFEQFETISDKRGAFRNKVESIVDSIRNGVPELAANTELVTDVLSKINAAAVTTLLTEELTAENDSAGAFSNTNAGILSSLQLAACLAKSGRASGMSIGHVSQDFHRGGSSVITAQSAAAVWAQLAVFWRWVLEQPGDLASRVMIVISHDFSRSEYNLNSIGAMPVTVNGVVQDVVSPGTDHDLTAGMIFISKDLGKGGGLRVGALDSEHTARATTDSGTIMTNRDAYHSMQIFGSTLIKAWPDLFKSPREVRKVWPSFKDEDYIPFLKA